MNINIEKQKVLSALASGNYEMNFTESSAISECRKYDGTLFYIFKDTNNKEKVDLGACYIEVADHEFHYNLNDGRWSCDIDELCEDVAVLEAIAALDGFVDYENFDIDEQWKVYSNINGLGDDVPYYWFEDDEAPRDVKTFGYCNVDVQMECYDCADMEKRYRTECTMSDADLYGMYRLLKEKDDMLDSQSYYVDFSCEEVRKYNADLYENLMQQVEEKVKSVYDGERQCGFVLKLSNELFEQNLGKNAAVGLARNH